MMKQRTVLLDNPTNTVSQSYRKPLVELLRAKPKTLHQGPAHLWKFYEDAHYVGDNNLEKPYEFYDNDSPL